MPVDPPESGVPSEVIRAGHSTVSRFPSGMRSSRGSKSTARSVASRADVSRSTSPALTAPLDRPRAQGRRSVASVVDASVGEGTRSPGSPVIGVGDATRSVAASVSIANPDVAALVDVLAAERRANQESIAAERAAIQREATSGLRAVMEENAALRAAAEADRKESAAERAAASAAQTALLLRLADEKEATELPPLIKLSKRSGYGVFYERVVVYLRHKKWSTGPSEELRHIGDGSEDDNSKASSRWFDKLEGCLSGEAKAFFLNQGTRYTGRGFDMLAKLDKEWGHGSSLEVAMKMYKFFKMDEDYVQGSKSPETYAKDMRGILQLFAQSGNPLAVPLQNMLMIRGLWSEYSPIIEMFQTGQKTFETETLDSIRFWCDNYSHPAYKEQGRGGSRPPSARAVQRTGGNDGGGGADVGENNAGRTFKTPWPWISSLSHETLKKKFDESLNGKNGFCFICQGHKTPRGEKQRQCPGPRDCKLLRSLGYKLTKQDAAPGGRRDDKSKDKKGASRDKSGGRAATAPTEDASSDDSSTKEEGGPNAGAASVAEGSESTGEEFEWFSDDDLADSAFAKSKSAVGSYLVSPSARVASVQDVSLIAGHRGADRRGRRNPSSSSGALESVLRRRATHGCGKSVRVRRRPGSARSVRFLDPLRGVKVPSVPTIRLPSALAKLLSQSPDHAIPTESNPNHLVVADTGATDHMIPDRSAFVSYHRVSNLRVRMADKGYAGVLGRGTAIISLNGKRVLIRDALHVPSLRTPLYSLRAHHRQKGCGFIGDESLGGIFVYFPGFILAVDTTSDCHLSYAPLGRSAALRTLHYAQPKPGALSNPPLTPCNPEALADAELPPSAAAVSERASARLQLLRRAFESLGRSPGRGVDDEPLVTFAPHHPKGGGGSASAVTRSMARQQNPAMDQQATFAGCPSLSQDMDSGGDEDPDPYPELEVPSPSPSPPLPYVTTEAGKSSGHIMTRDEILARVHPPNAVLPDVRACDTANDGDRQRSWTPEQLHHITGCRTFKNYQRILQLTSNGRWIDAGESPLALGHYSTVRRSRRGRTIDRTKYRYLDRVHVDIGFGDTVAVGGARYALVFVDRATRYNWVFPLKTLDTGDILAAFNLFRSEAGGFSKCFRCDCDPKLFGRAVKNYLTHNESDIKAAGAGRQSSNGLVESHWKVMVHMSRAYLTGKQMSRAFWYHSIAHAARMMNMLPGTIHGSIVSPFMLVHGVAPDVRTWVPLFSICYFRQGKDSKVKRSKNQANSLDGIVLGRSPTSNALLVYNPRNKSYYEPVDYTIDPHRIPGAMYSEIKYDGGLFCSLKRDVTLSDQDEAYPPGTRVEHLDPVTKVTRSGTVMDIPMDPTVPDSEKTYLVRFDDASTLSVPMTDMPPLIPDPPPLLDEDERLLPPFLRVNKKVTYLVDGTYYKGYLGRREGIYRFDVKRHPNSKSLDWSKPLRDLPANWGELCREATLLPGHTDSTFLRDASSVSISTPGARSAETISLHRGCPASLLEALSASHPDQEVWMSSYQREKDSILDLGTYEKITLGEYRALREKGAPRALPTMCVLTIKTDENMDPVKAKSRIVVLGNLEERNWSKSDKYAPVLRPDSLRFLVSEAVHQRRRLKQGDVQNAFCNSDLPADEVTIVRPPIGDPTAKRNEFWLLRKTLYGLRRSPRHWYDKISGIFRAMGLRPNSQDPCVFSGFVRDPDDPSDNPSSVPLTVGLYVDDFVYFSSADEVEAKFQRILGRLLPVDFMGDVEWFLGTHFLWHTSEEGHVDVHMNQAGYARNTAERFGRADRSITPDATPWRSGVPIDSVAAADEDDDSPAQTRRREAYQSLVGSIGWLANCTRPDVAPAHSFLSSYLMRPALGHMKAALYVLHYIHSTHDYGIYFTSRIRRPVHTYVHHPHSSDTEAYEDAVPPVKGQHHRFTTYSDACWGSQLGNSVRAGTLLPLFKLRSMSGAVVFRMGGPLSWTAPRQQRTSLSSCEAEVRATNEGTKLTMALRHFASSYDASGTPLPELAEPAMIYNDNEACVIWANGFTTKGLRHIEHRENYVRELVQDGAVRVAHVPGKCNPSDIFTKEMKDGAHFRRLRDSFMSRAANFASSTLANFFRRQSPVLH